MVRLAMHPLDVVESDRWNEAIRGLEPQATIEEHARYALEMLRSWLQRTRAGRQVRTRRGDKRVLPRSTTMLARQYVHDRFQPRTSLSVDQERMLRQSYVYALDVSICRRLEDIAALLSHRKAAVRNKARRWMPVAWQLRLEDHE